MKGLVLNKKSGFHEKEWITLKEMASLRAIISSKMNDFH